MKQVEYKDGRIGWPDILEYEITEGPEKGNIIPVPPTHETHPHPDPTTVLMKKCLPYMRPSCAYRMIVYDHEGYEKLYKAGLIYGPPHARKGDIEFIDNRIAPGA